MFRVVKCPNCYLLVVSGASKVFKCQRCSKTRVFSNLEVYYKSEDSRDAAAFLGKMKEENAKSRREYSEDFGTYRIN